ncbi:MAG: shikimate dehydrogenase [Candidatus Dasytiphilus stammeri]
MINYALFGNPVKHSKSPRIHELFAEQMKIHNHSYGIYSPSLNKFPQTLHTFFSKGAKGANITTPFKQKAFLLSDKLTKRALLAGSVNTFKKLENNLLLGDNTDGIGLLTDLQRIRIINSTDKILIIGSGGAAHGIIEPLLSYGCSIIITNRNICRAEKLVHRFRNYGSISAVDVKILEKHKFDLILNATSCGIEGKIPLLPNKIINRYTRCYDLFYDSKITPFLEWCKKLGAEQYADGIGMLVGQAAYSFFLWHGLLPNITPVIKLIKYEMRKIF